MKRQITLVALMLIFSSVSLMAQANQETKPFKIKVSTTKGKPYKSSSNAPSYAFLKSEMKPYMLDKQGTCTINVTQNDTVYFAFSTYTGLIPVAGLDSIDISIDKNKLYAPKANSGGGNNVYKVMQNSEITTPMNYVDPAQLSGAYRDLAQLIQGRFPGVSVTNSNTGGYNISIRGSASLKGAVNQNSDTDGKSIKSTVSSGTQPLILVDGSQTDFDTANSLDLNDIQSLEVIKDGAAYGVRGANGVILIKTKGH